MTFGSLFSGIGGIDLGLERAGMTCKWQVEIDSYATRVLEKHWPNVKRYRDITKINPDELEKVSVVAGGFPCQDISSANTKTREGMKGAKSGLWHEFYRVIRSVHPKFVLVENVADSRVAGWVSIVRSDLWRSGYSSLPIQLRASEFGAPFTGSRVFIAATNSKGKSALCFHEETSELSKATRFGGNWRTSAPWNMGVANGIPHRVDRLRGLGNAVVPQIAQWIGERIMECENNG